MNAKAKQLKLNNDNNSLACNSFIQIHFAPAKDNLPPLSKLQEQLYCTRIDDEDIFLRLVDLLFITFEQINDHFTLWASGKLEQEWKKEWMERFPATDRNTKMAVYYYQRAK